MQLCPSPHSHGSGLWLKHSVQVEHARREGSAKALTTPETLHLCPHSFSGCRQPAILKSFRRSFVLAVYEEQRTRSTIEKAIQLGSTIFPDVFATVAGKTLEIIARFCTEKASKLEVSHFALSCICGPHHTL